MAVRAGGGVRRPAAVARGVLAALFAIAVAGGGAPAGATDFLDSYKKGLEFAEREDWAAAAQEMEEAIADRPQETGRLLRHLYLKPYLPHYHLGVARAELGDCRAALAAFAESESQGAIQGRDEFADLQARRTACEARTSAAEAAAGRAAEAVKRAAAAADTVAGLAGAHELAGEWERGEPSFAARQREAGGRLAAARERLATSGSGQDTAAFEEVTAEAVAARGQFEAIGRDAEARIAEIRERRQAGREALDRAAAAARSTLEATADLAPYPPQVGSRRSEVEQLVAESDRLAAEAPAAEAEALRERLATAVARLQGAAAPPPEELLSAADAFFAGDYDRTLELLDGARFRDNRSVAHAHLLAAAARFALAAGAGDREEALLDEARRDVEACYRADPALRPAAEAFSPRFVEFFAATAARGGG